MEYLTIKQASELVGKSEDTIRRLIKHVVKAKPDEASLFIKKQGNDKTFYYTVSDELLRQTFDMPTQTPDVPTQLPSPVVHQSEMQAVVDVLREQLRIKDEQIADLGKKVDNLIERSRETNILLKGLQNMLALNSGQDAATVNVEPQPKPADEPTSDNQPPTP